MIEVEHLSKTFPGPGGTPVAALRDATFAIEPGEFVAIRGASGAGKSTLLNLLGCLDRPTSGSYRLSGETVGDLDDDALSAIRARRIGFVFQAFNLLPRCTALENVALPQMYAGGPVRPGAAAEALDRVGLADRKDHFPSQLSGGEQQRVAIARALVNDPALILADEPTGNLDDVAGRQVMSLLEDLNEDGRTLIVVTHDTVVAARGRRTLTLRNGLVQDQGARP